MARSDLKLAKLREAALLSGLGRKALEFVAQSSDILTFPAGSVVSRSTDTVRPFVFVLSGRAEVRGERSIHDCLAVGEHFGAIDLLAGRTGQPFEVGMVTDGDLLIIGPREFSSLVDSVSGFTRRLAQQFARQLQDQATFSLGDRFQDVSTLATDVE